MSITLTRICAAVVTFAMGMNCLSAKDIYLSADGDDSNTGLTPDSPRKTLYGLNEGGTYDNDTNARIIRSGDVIHISGFLKMSDERAAVEAANNGSVPANTTGQFHIEGTNQTGFRLHSDGSRKGWDWCGVTFVGENPETDGFDGEYQSRIFDLNNPDNGKNWEFRNLTFKRGLMPNAGGGAIIMRNNANARFINCVFDDNHFDYSALKAANEDGMDILKPDGLPEMDGAVKLAAVLGAEFDGCVFTNNMSRLGGAMFVGGDNVRILNCLFENNKAEYEGKYIKNTHGGAIAVRTQWNQVRIDIDNTIFVGNSAYNNGGALYFQMSISGKDRFTHANITNCYFAKNDCIWENGGAFNIGWSEWPDGTKILAAKFGNCTFYDNSAGFYGACGYVQGGVKGSETTFVNCTITGNHQNNMRDTNCGHGCGIVFNDADCDLYENGVLVSGQKQARFQTDDIMKRFLNCIIEDNYNVNGKVGADNNGDYNDLSFLGNFRTVYDTDDAKANLIIDHTCIRRSIEGNVNTANFPTAKIGYIGTNKFNESYKDGYLADADEYVHKPYGSHSVWGVLPIAEGDKAQDALDMGDESHWSIPSRDVSLVFDFEALSATMKNNYGRAFSIYSRMATNRPSLSTTEASLR